MNIGAYHADTGQRLANGLFDGLGQTHNVGSVKLEAPLLRKQRLAAAQLLLVILHSHVLAGVDGAVTKQGELENRQQGVERGCWPKNTPTCVQLT